MRGPGKYDHLATMVRELTDARAVIVMVLDGNLGDGFSLQIEGDLKLDLPRLLRDMADEIEGDHDGPQQTQM